MYEKDLSLQILYDLYCPLLPEKKREIFELYYGEDLSLSEISDYTGTSRQAVRDIIARTVAELSRFEECLGLLKKNRELEAIYGEIKTAADKNDMDLIKKLVLRAEELL